MYQKIAERAEELFEEIKLLRREFHRFPEVAWTEKTTTAKIVEYLENLGFDPVSGDAVSGHDTGAVIEIKNGDGPVVVLRFDIDGLPNAESTNPEHFPNANGFASGRDGFMHACGHDGHIAIGLGVSKLLSEIKDEIHGTVRIIFQPAEEGCKGARAVTAKGWLDDADYLLAGHIVPRSYVEINGIPKEMTYTWNIVPVTGSFATTKIDAEFTGKAAHAATPEKGLSVMPAMAEAVLNLTNLDRPTGGKTVLNVGRFDAGEGRNIIAGIGKLELEVRGVTTALNDYMQKNAVEVLEAATKKYGVGLGLEIPGSAPSIESDEDFYKPILEMLKAETDINPSDGDVFFNASEDIAVMMERVHEHGGKAVYFLLPTDAVASLHKPDYSFDESVLKTAVTIYCAAVAYIMK